MRECVESLYILSANLIPYDVRLRRSVYFIIYEKVSRINIFSYLLEMSHRYEKLLQICYNLRPRWFIRYYAIEPTDIIYQFRFRSLEIKCSAWIKKFVWNFHPHTRQYSRDMVEYFRRRNESAFAEIFHLNI